MKRAAVQPLEDVGRLERLADEADRGGHEFVSRMISDWIQGTNRFDAAGERAYVVTMDGRRDRRRRP